MTAHVSPVATAQAAQRLSGALAVVGLVIAFSLSSTLVKRANTPGVLVAFWRLTTVSVIWNLYLRATGRRVTMADVRQAFIPAIFFGLNLAIFFAGATKNSVTNAALIGSLSPFLIVPLGAYLFKEHINPRALPLCRNRALASSSRPREIARCRPDLVLRRARGGVRTRTSFRTRRFKTSLPRPMRPAWSV